MPEASTFGTALGLTASKFKSDHIVSCIDRSVKLGEITDCLSARGAARITRLPQSGTYFLTGPDYN
jgi:hypothetical protein